MRKRTQLTAPAPVFVDSLLIIYSEPSIWGRGIRRTVSRVFLVSMGWGVAGAVTRGVLRTRLTIPWRNWRSFSDHTAFFGGQSGGGHPTEWRPVDRALVLRKRDQLGGP